MRTFVYKFFISQRLLHYVLYSSFFIILRFVFLSIEQFSSVEKSKKSLLRVSASVWEERFLHENSIYLLDIYFSRDWD